MSNNISGKVVVITGASSGLGEATARHLSQLGAKLVLAARRQERLEQLVSELVAAGGEAVAYPTDVTRADEVKALIQGALDTFGRVDVLVNNAHSIINKPPEPAWLKGFVVIAMEPYRRLYRHSSKAVAAR